MHGSTKLTKKKKSYVLFLVIPLVRISFANASEHSVPSSEAPMRTEQCSEKSAYKIQTWGITKKKGYNTQNRANVWNQLVGRYKVTCS